MQLCPRQSCHRSPCAQDAVMVVESATEKQRGCAWCRYLFLMGTLMAQYTYIGYEA